ncbi:hypothetical protein N7G274_006883 [Stereocaulon virgatum]|uniref:Uncharacterized protein n=1 Tax=Stereocaulon virgatum TaxID=373712 RepID=A0ABR4A5U8_9LECA
MTCSDHFNQKVKASLRRDIPIITTPHAKEHLTTSKEPNEAFTAVYDLDIFDDILVDIKPEKEGKKPAIKATDMPGKNVPPGPGNLVGKTNDLLAALRVSPSTSPLANPFSLRPRSGQRN